MRDDHLDSLLKVRPPGACASDLTQDIAGAATASHRRKQATGDERLKDAAALTGLQGPQGAQILVGDGAVAMGEDQSDLRVATEPEVSKARDPESVSMMRGLRLYWASRRFLTVTQPARVPGLSISIASSKRRTSTADPLSE